MDLRIGGQIELKFRFADLSPEKTPPYRSFHDTGGIHAGDEWKLDVR